MRFVPYTPALQNECTRIFRSNFPTFFSEPEEKDLLEFLSFHGKGQYWLLEVDSHYVGCGGIAINPDGAGRLCWGMIDGRLHRHGYGTELILFRLQKLAQNQRVTKIGLDTSHHNPNFFGRFGFKVTRQESNRYGPGIHGVDMELELSELNRQKLLNWKPNQ